MQIGIAGIWHIIVDDNVNTLDVDSSTKQIRSDKNALFEVLELLVTCESFLL